MNRLECRICLHPLQEPYALLCGDVFCRACLRTFLEADGRQCPLCRHAVGATVRADLGVPEEEPEEEEGPMRRRMREDRERLQRARAAARRWEEIPELREAIEALERGEGGDRIVAFVQNV